MSDHPGRECGTCGAVMYHDSPEDQYRLCGVTILCPAWKPGLRSAPQWVGEARRSMEWQARRAEEKRREQDQPVPE